MSKKLDDLMEGVVARLIEAVEAADGDWTKPWKSLASASPHQVENGRPYRGINAVILWIDSMLAGLVDPRWGTYKTWQRVGAQVRTGEKSTKLVFWKPLYRCESCDLALDEDQEAAVEHRDRGHKVYQTPILQWFSVFNAAQVDDAPPFDLEGVPDVEAQHRVAAEFVEATGCQVVDHPNRAYFVTTQPDKVFVPAIGQFDSEDRYWGTVFHELTHWSGHKSRLDRLEPAEKGSPAYASEELVAELGSAFLSAHLRVQTEPHPESAEYLAYWLGVIREEPRRLYVAARDASTAVRYLTDLADEDEAAA